MRSRRSFILPLVLGLLGLACLWSPAAVSAEVDANQVIRGEARFTVLSPTLIRMEYAPGGEFLDAPTTLVQNRDFPICQFRAAEQDGKLVITTPSAELRWEIGKLPFAADNLSICWKTGGKEGTWVPGQDDKGNLGGTRGALDGIGRGNLPPLDDGLLSREGWTLLDDSERPLWLGEEQWLKPREGEGTDWYFFCYGNEYGQMLLHYVDLCGRVPMLPRYAFGPWFSRYWAYTQQDIVDVVSEFRERGFPLDVMVIDVDWHKYGWEGYDWNEELIPDWTGLLSWLHEQGLHTTLNNHPGSPLPVEDSHYTAAAQMVGLGGEDLGKPLAWDLADQRSNRAFVEAVHRPLEEKGVDFWWIDGAAPSQMRGLDPSIWCAKTYYDGTARTTGKRSLIFSRYGGLGQHRYPAGFSGDVFSEWEVLDYEVPFTARAGNVVFPYWSHDIGGFHGNKIDPELYVRWVQFGTFSPILRLHSNHGVREPWEYGAEAEGIVRDYFQFRERLYPYLNSCQRITHETGTPLCRAMYMQWPEHEEAYRADGQYMLGPEVLVAPVTTPAGPGGKAAKSVWIPPGLWLDGHTSEPFVGPKTIVYQADLATCPIFIRAGGIVPMQPDMQYVGQKPADPVSIAVGAGADGSFDLYEDDGLSMDYLTGGFALSPLQVKQEAGALHVAIGATKGTYEGARKERSYIIAAGGLVEPSAVKLDGKELPRVDVEPGEDVPIGCWAYEARNSTVTASCPGTRVDQRHVVTIEAPFDPARMETIASLRAQHNCAQAALDIARAAGADQSVTAAVEAAATAATSAIDKAIAAGGDAGSATTGPALAALTAAWQAIGRSGMSAARRDECLESLIGLCTSATIAPVPDSTDYAVKLVAGSRVVVPGAKITALPLLTEPWVLAVKPVDDLAAFGTTGAATMSFSVAPPAAGLQPVLGAIEFGALVQVDIGGVALQRRVTTGFDCSFVQLWHLIGPFANEGGKGLQTVYPPEEKVDLTATYSAMEGEARWQSTKWKLPAAGVDPSVFINLEPRFMPKDGTIAYAVTYIVSDREKEAVLSIGTDDGCKAWLNGEQILDHPEPRAPSPGQDRVPVTLHKGTNTVMIKVANEGGQWGLYLQVTDKDGKPLAGLRSVLQPEG